MEFFTEFPELGRRSQMELRKGIDLAFRNFSKEYGDSIEAFFDPLLFFLVSLEKLLLSTPWIIIIGIICGLAWLGSRSWKLVVGSAIAFLLIGYFGMWEDCMATVAIITVCTIICIVVGIPIGIVMARSSRAEKAILPVLDMMQTIPSFVYLIPILMLLGIGKVPGLIAVCVYAVPPIIRLTNLGIRQVGKGFKEAGSSLGLTKFLILVKIEIPLSLKTIMAGVNQTLMLALSMVVIAALIGAGGLGLTVYIALGRLDVGSAVIGGTGIVILAIILDRITQKIIKTR